MSAPPPEFSRPFEAAKVGLKPRIRKIAAEPAERDGLARRFGLLGIERLEAELTVAAKGRDGLRVTGRVEAEVVQACVVTLAPVPARLAFEVERLYEEGAPDPNAFDGDFASLMEGEEPPDPIVDGKIDLGELAAEELALSLDPYPRAPGAHIPEQWAAESPDEGASPTYRPFTVLKGGRDA